MDFKAYPTHDRYRAMALVSPKQTGFDVYALQSAINVVIGAPLVTDGVLGQRTAGGIHALQQKLAIEDDGVAGGVTQRTSILFIARQIVAPGSLEFRAAKGQLEHESSNLLGNYSDKRDDPTAPLGWSYDAGAAQMNTAHTDPRDGFNPGFAIARLISHLKDYYGRFHDLALFRGQVHTDRRRWSLAVGAWNAPAWASWLAGVRPWAEPTAAQEATLEEYMRDCTVYLS